MLALRSIPHRFLLGPLVFRALSVLPGHLFRRRGSVSYCAHRVAPNDLALFRAVARPPRRGGPLPGHVGRWAPKAFGVGRRYRRVFDNRHVQRKVAMAIWAEMPPKWGPRTSDVPG